MKVGVDYIGVGVGAAIFNSERKIFLMLRGAKAKNERGKWDCPGGAVEFGETFEASLKREVREEHNVDIEVIELLGICDHIISEEKQHWVAPTYICKIVKGEPEILEPEKCDEIGWFALDEAEQLPLTLTTSRDIQLLKKKYPEGYQIS